MNLKSLRNFTDKLQKIKNEFENVIGISNSNKI
jgi:hypothetical protein